eukprot:jgi/Psemu1/59460/gm1.59460_g
MATSLPCVDVITAPIFPDPAARTTTQRRSVATTTTPADATTPGADATTATAIYSSQEIYEDLCCPYRLCHPPSCVSCSGVQTTSTVLLRSGGVVYPAWHPNYKHTALLRSRGLFKLQALRCYDLGDWCIHGVRQSTWGWTTNTALLQMIPASAAS